MGPPPPGRCGPLGIVGVVLLIGVNGLSSSPRVLLWMTWVLLVQCSSVRWTLLVWLDIGNIWWFCLIPSLMFSFLNSLTASVGGNVFSEENRKCGPACIRCRNLLVA